MSNLTHTYATAVLPAETLARIESYKAHARELVANNQVTPNGQHHTYYITDNDTTHTTRHPSHSPHQHKFGTCTCDDWIDHGLFLACSHVIATMIYEKIYNHTRHLVDKYGLERLQQRLLNDLSQDNEPAITNQLTSLWHATQRIEAEIMDSDEWHEAVDRMIHKGS